MLDPVDAIAQRLAAERYDLIGYLLCFVTHDREDAEDLAQDAYIRALEALRRGQFDGRNCAAYLRTVARRLHIDQRRHVQRSLVRQPVPLDQAVSMPDERPSTAPERETLRTLERAALSEALHEVLGRLSPGQRDALRLSVTLSQRESAAAMGKSVEAVKALRLRGYRTARKALTSAGWTAQGWAT